VVFTASALELGTRVIYQLKVTLEGVEPPIWRRLQVISSNSTLAELHRFLQAAFGWEDYHLHVFTRGKVNYGVPSREDYRPVQDERKVVVSDVLTKPREHMVYEYDFGDSWEHRLVLEKILPSAEEWISPRCVEGERAAPPEDSGGSYRYMELVEAVGDPAHPEHHDFIEWLGGGWDAEAFDLTAVNKSLARRDRKARRR
jgi:hypothetical protein